MASLDGVATLLLVRHGETEWNRTSRWQGQADPPLNDLGREQARALAATLREEPIAAAYSSDLRRALETAELLASPHRLEVRVDARLREVDVGGWSGLSTAEIEDSFPEGVVRWRAGDPEHSFENGETYAAMGGRVVTALAEIGCRHVDDQVLVVLHGGPVRALLAHAAGVSYEEQRARRGHVANCDVVRISVEDGAFRGID